METTTRAIQGGIAMKRHTPLLRSEQEIIADNDKGYYEMIKHPSKINPVFTGKPYILAQRESKEGAYEKCVQS